MLWAMLITWLAQGRPTYVSQDGRVAFISDIGADFLKPLFVAGCAVTGIGFVMCLVIERCLRHSARCVFEYLFPARPLFNPFVGCFLICEQERKFSVY